MISYSERGFTILALSKEQLCSGALRAFATPWTLPTARRKSLTADGRRHMPAPKHGQITLPKWTERTFEFFMTGHVESCGGGPAADVTADVFIAVHTKHKAANTQDGGIRQGASVKRRRRWKTSKAAWNHIKDGAS